MLRRGTSLYDTGERRALSSPPPAGREGDILLVEDDPDHTEAMSYFLAGEGYRIRPVASGRAALASALEEAPDLVLLDMGLPDMDGFAVAEALAEDPATANVPILFVSGSDDLMLRIRGAQLAEADFLMKPFAPEELLARTERSLSAAVEHQRLRDEANLDALTGLGNLRLLKRRFALEETRHRRHRTPLSLVLIDADGLKQMNDQRGHLAGDEFLAGIGDALQNGARSTDLAVRYGGDEFVVLLPNTSPERAEQFAGRTLERIRALRPHGVPVSVSIGIASLGAQAHGSLQRLLERADEALYRAKRAGGDRMCAAAQGS